MAAWGLGLYGAPPVPAEPPRQLTPQASVARLKALVEAAEAAVKAEDWETAQARLEEADVLAAGLPDAILKLNEVQGLLERLRDVQRLLEDDEEELALTGDGDVAPLRGEELRLELERVRVAEAGEVYDFPIDLNDKVATWVHLFTTSRRGFMEAALSRGTQYLPMIRQVFAEEGLPTDLAYLALIESAFKNEARSHAAAVGMWQFIRATGRSYGLDNNAWIDERQDPVASTRAAARYLKRMYDTRGDWYLAMAGYNCGPGKVDRAVAALGTKNYWDISRSRFIPPDTRHYVPQILAAILIGRNPEKYGLNVTQMTPFAYEQVEVDRMTSLRAIARFAETDPESLKALNPELLRGSTPPGRHVLKVPAGTGVTVARALSSMPSTQRLDFTPYVVRKGDTLARVAARYKVTPEDLLDFNDLKASQFRKGLKILVPPPPAVRRDAADVERRRAEPSRPVTPLGTLPEIPAARPLELAAAPDPKAAKADVVSEAKGEAKAEPKADVRPAPKRKAPEEPARPRTHTVKRGETLFSIAARYDLEVSDLRKWNKIRRDRIQPGDKLKLSR